MGDSHEQKSTVCIKSVCVNMKLYQMSILSEKIILILWTFDFCLLFLELVLVVGAEGLSLESSKGLEFK